MAFQKLNTESLRRIRPLLASKFPKSAMMLNIFDMTLSGKFPDDDNVRIYGYNGVPDESNLFIDAIMKAKDQDVEYSIIYAPEQITKEMVNAFDKLYDWTKIMDYGATPMHFVEVVQKLVKEKGGELTNGPADDMYLPIDEALNLNIEREELKEQFEVRKLSPEHAGKVNSHWKYGGEGYDRSIAEAIRAFGAAGIFKKIRDDASSAKGQVLDEHENLVSWVIITRVGTLNALHTLDEYRCKGLGRWTMEAASKWMAEVGWIPLCEIEPYNKQSRRLMEKIGFKFVQTVCWMRYTPPVQPP